MTTKQIMKLKPHDNRMCHLLSQTLNSLTKKKKLIGGVQILIFCQHTVSGHVGIFIDNDLCSVQTLRVGTKALCV